MERPSRRRGVWPELGRPAEASPEKLTHSVEKEAVATCHPRGDSSSRGDSKSQGMFMGPRGRSLWPQPGEEGGSGISRALWAVG